MPFLTWIVSKITGEALKAGGEVAKTATEIPKNIAETRKAHLEIEHLQAQRAVQEQLIVRATLDDVRKYDPNYQRLDERVQAYSERHEYRPSLSRRSRRGAGFVLMMAVLLLLILGIVLAVFFLK